MGKENNQDLTKQQERQEGGEERERERERERENGAHRRDASWHIGLTFAVSRGWHSSLETIPEVALPRHVSRSWGGRRSKHHQTRTTQAAGNHFLAPAFRIMGAAAGEWIDGNGNASTGTLAVRFMRFRGESWGTWIHGNGNANTGTLAVRFMCFRGTWRPQKNLCEQIRTRVQ